MNPQRCPIYRSEKERSRPRRVRTETTLELRDEGYKIEGGKVPVLIGDFSPAEARLLLVATDRLRGFPDPVKMGEYLKTSQEELGLLPEDFEWTGLSIPEINDHLALLSTPEDLQDKLRELVGGADEDVNSLSIKFASEQLEMLEEVVASYDVEAKKELRERWGHLDDRGHVIALLCEQYLSQDGDLDALEEE